MNIASKKIMYISLIRPHLTYGSQIWRPHLIKDMIALERIQRRATKYILNDYSSDYKYRLLTLQLLPLMMEFEVYDIMFFIRCLKDSSSSDSFSVLSFIRFSRGTTRASSHLKMIHSLSRTNSASHFYFNRLPRLWNSLPPIDITLSLSAIKKQLRQIFWNHFFSILIAVIHVHSIICAHVLNVLVVVFPHLIVRSPASSLVFLQYTFFLIHVSIVFHPSSFMCTVKC